MKTPYTTLARHLALPALAALTASCVIGPGSAPAPTYQLAPAELAWQGYQPGQEMHFGRAGTTKIRTFRVLDVQDKTDGQASTALVPSHETYQTITVLGRRTDSVTYIFRSKTDSIPAVDTFLKLYKYADKNTESVVTRAEVGWAKTFSHSLPVAEVTTSQSIQDPAVELLPQVVLGGINYGPTLRLTSAMTANGLSRGLRVVRRIYYAQGKGVVAYEEEGTGLWYRLP